MQLKTGRTIGAAAALIIIGVAACGDNSPTGDQPIDPTNRRPTARVSASPLNVPVSDGHATVVTIDGSQSADPDNDLLTYTWVVPSGRFVDGTSDGDPIIKVTFPGAAPYRVVLTVRDGRGGSNVAEITIGLLAR